MGCHSLLQGIFPTWESNLGLPHCRQILYHLSCNGSLNWSQVSFFRFLVEFYFQKKFLFYYFFLKVENSQKFLFMVFKTVYDMIITHLTYPLNKCLLCPMGDATYSTHSLIFGILHQTGPISVLNFVRVWFQMHLSFFLLPSTLRGCPLWTPPVGSFAFSLGLAIGGHQQGTQGLEQRWPLHIAALPRFWSSLLSSGPFVLLT